MLGLEQVKKPVTPAQPTTPVAPETPVTPSDTPSQTPETNTNPETNVTPKAEDNSENSSKEENIAPKPQKVAAKKMAVKKKTANNFSKTVRPLAATTKANNSQKVKIAAVNKMANKKEKASLPQTGAKKSLGALLGLLRSAMGILTIEINPKKQKKSK